MEHSGAAMPRVGLTPAAVVDAGLAIVDSAGIDGLTLAAVAERAGVASPSLYKHVGGLPDLRALVGVRVLEELTARLTRAVLGRAGDDAVAALMREIRAYVREYPFRYAAAPADPLSHPAMAAAGAALLDVFLAVLRGYGLDGSGAIHATRCLRAVVHGFAVIEAAGGFGLPEDLDGTYEQLIRMFTGSLNSGTFG